MSDIEDTRIGSPNFYYESEFLFPTYALLSQYALDLAIETTFANMLFYGDLSRIVYASNDYSFQRRTEMSENGLLDVPFMSYYCTGMSLDTNRKLFKNSNQVLPLPDLNNHATNLGYGIKIIPLHLTYEATCFFSQDKDLQYAMSKLLFQSANETIIYGLLNAGKDSLGVENILKNPSFMKSNLEFKPTFSENDFLQKNNLQSIAIDFEFDTYAVYPAVANVLRTPQGVPNPLYIAEEVILNFLYTKGDLLKTSELANTSPQNLLTYYFNTGN